MSLCCGSISGFVSSTLTFPLDVVRRRLQLEGQHGGERLYNSYGHAVREIIRHNGLRGLYAGIIPEYAKVMPGVALTFCAFESLKSLLGVSPDSAKR